MTSKYINNNPLSPSLPPNRCTATDPHNSFTTKCIRIYKCGVLRSQKYIKFGESNSYAMLADSRQAHTRFYQCVRNRRQHCVQYDLVQKFIRSLACTRNGLIIIDFPFFFVLFRTHIPISIACYVYPVSREGERRGWIPKIRIDKID